MNAQRRTLLVTCLCTAVCLAATASGSTAADEFPNRTIKIVVPAPPGSLLDVVPRIIAEKLSSKWGIAVIIENRPGAAQNLGAEVVAKSDPDGYTLLASPPGPLVVSQHLRSKLNFDPSAFVPVSVMVKIPAALVVNPKCQCQIFKTSLLTQRQTRASLPSDHREPAAHRILLPSN